MYILVYLNYVNNHGKFQQNKTLNKEDTKEKVVVPKEKSDLE